jgi:hypothetical protein
MECWPRARVDEERVATPEPFNGADPSVVAPSLNVTVPVGTPDEEPETLAVRETAVPTRDGFALDAKEIEMFSWTISLTAADVLARLLGSPL